MPPIKKVLITAAITLILLHGCSISPLTLNKTVTHPYTPKNTVISWTQLEPGLEHATLVIPQTPTDSEKTFELVKITPRTHEFGVYQNTTQETAKSIGEIQQSEKAAFTLNGGFFTEDFRPTGLLISNGKKLHTQSNASLLNGIFAIDKEGKGILLDQKDKPDPKIYPFAIQNGPVLIDNDGNIMIKSDTGKLASRSLIGLDKSDNIIFIFIKQGFLNPTNSISLYELAHLLKENTEFSRIGAHSILNLDGGTSTGFMIKDKYFPELEKIQNAVIIKPPKT